MNVFRQLEGRPVRRSGRAYRTSEPLSNASVACPRPRYQPRSLRYAAEALMMPVLRNSSPNGDEFPGLYRLDGACEVAHGFATWFPGTAAPPLPGTHRNRSDLIPLGRGLPDRRAGSLFVARFKNSKERTHNQHFVTACFTRI